MSIRQDLDVAHAGWTAGPAAGTSRPRWRMSAGNRHALAADLCRRELPDSYLGLPIEVAADIRGWELVWA